MKKNLYSDKKENPIYLKIIFTLIVIVMFINDFAGLPWYCKYLLLICAIGLGAIKFLVTVDTVNIDIVLELILLLLVPYFVMFFISLLAWVLDFQTLDYIMRGTSTLLYQILIIIFVAASIYMFGTDAVYMIFYGCIAGNAYLLMLVVKEFGVGKVITDLFYLVITFADNTGDAARMLEQAGDYTYAFGVFFFFFLSHSDKGKKNIIHLILSLVFFLMAFKRASILAIALCVLFCYLVKKFNDKWRERSCILVGTGLVIAAFAYVVMVKYGILDWIVETFNINTMGRMILYRFICQYFEFSITYLGYGIGFVNRLFQSRIEAGNPVFAGIEALHSDILLRYVELGFLGFSFWIIYEIILVPLWFFKRADSLSGVLVMGISIYYYLTCFTDNTVSCFCVNIAFWLSMFGFLFENVELWREKRSK